MKLLELKGVPILKQLQIEEALLRTESGNFVVINSEAPPAIVMGISGKEEELLNLTLIKDHRVPVIRRYSGGGTVYIDHNTLFVSFICDSPLLNITPFPHDILEWSEKLYRPLFPEGFSLRENDYVFGEKKFGGNAQYIKKDRFVHHTSFLWDYSEEKMEYLLLPKKRPKYRGERSHKDFLTPLSKSFSTKEEILNSLKTLLKSQFEVKTVSLEDLQPILERPHRKGTVNVL